MFGNKKSRKRLDLANRKGGELIRNVIHAVWPWRLRIGELVHCPSEKAFFSSNEIFLQFLPSNVPIMIHNIRRRVSFLKLFNLS